MRPLISLFWASDKQLQEMTVKFPSSGQPGQENPRCIPCIVNPEPTICSCAPLTVAGGPVQCSGCNTNCWGAAESFASSCFATSSWLGQQWRAHAPWFSLVGSPREWSMARQCQPAPGSRGSGWHLDKPEQCGHRGKQPVVCVSWKVSLRVERTPFATRPHRGSSVLRKVRLCFKILNGFPISSES